MQLLLHQLRAVLTTDSEEIRVGGGFAGDLTYEESCNRLCLVLASFPGCVSSPSPACPLPVSVQDPGRRFGPGPGPPPNTRGGALSLQTRTFSPGRAAPPLSRSRHGEHQRMTLLTPGS